MAGPVVRGPGVDWQCSASLVGFDPTLLSCAKKRGVEPPRRNCYFTLARKYTRVRGPLCDPRGSSFILPHRSSVFYGFCQHSLFGLQLQSGMQYVQRSDCRAANLQSFAAARHFCSAKILAGGLRWGWGPQRRGRSSRAKKFPEEICFAPSRVCQICRTPDQQPLKST